MIVIVMLSVVLVVEGSMLGEVVKVVVVFDDFEVFYEMNLMGMVIEVDDIDELFVVVGVVYKVVDGDCVSMFLKIDDKCMKEQMVVDKVDVVEVYFGWEVRSDCEQCCGLWLWFVDLLCGFDV